MSNDKTGIYAIIHVPSGRRYIGAATRIGNRWGVHLWHLRRGTHHSQYLQRVWNKHDQAEFEFVVLWECRVEELDHYEAVYMEFYLDCLLNTRKVAGNARGYEVSKETRARMSVAARRVADDPEERRRRSERARRQHTEGKLGRKTWKISLPEKLREWVNSEENKCNLAIARKKGLGNSLEMGRRALCRKTIPGSLKHCVSCRSKLVRGYTDRQQLCPNCRADVEAFKKV